MTIAVNFIQKCYLSKSVVVRWPLKKYPVTTSIWVKSFSCSISFQNKQQLKLFINSEHHLEKKKWKLAPYFLCLPLHTATHTSLFLPYVWGVCLSLSLFLFFLVSLFSHVFLLYPFPLYSKQQSESQCHRDPGPQPSLEKWKTRWITKSISMKTVSEPDQFQICSESLRHLHTNDIDITIPGFWIYVVRNLNSGKTKDLLLCK